MKILPPLKGLLFFPVTPFDSEDRVDIDLLSTHIDLGLAHRPGAVFAACGTGEFHALNLLEYHKVIETSVHSVAGAMPVIGATGGPISLAKEVAKVAEALGASALLVLPPFLVHGSPKGLVRYVQQVAESTTLPLVIYNRDNAIYDPESVATLSTFPSVAGLKDGLGNIELMTRLTLAVQSSGRTDFQFFNGLPTAEVSTLAYRAIGIRLYSSAAFSFVPEVAVSFYEALETDDLPRVKEMLRAFFVPLVELRNQIPGGAVSLVKAGLRLRGLDVGGVRAPLLDPEPSQLATLRSLIETGLGLIDADGERTFDIRAATAAHTSHTHTSAKA